MPVDDPTQPPGDLAGGEVDAIIDLTESPNSAAYVPPEIIAQTLREYGRGQLSG